MGYSVRIARIAGTDIKVHWSFILVILFVAQLFQPFTLSSVLMAFFVVASVFSYILLHELGHSFAARRFGIATTSIVLWPLGGFANLSSQPRRPLHQLVIAAAGPLVNLLLAGFFYVMESLLWTRLLAGDQSGMVMLYGFASSAVFVNMFLALLNLVPAYPLDGGRIARAVLTMIAGPRRADAIMLPFSWLAAAGIAWYAWQIGDMTLLFGALLIALAAGTLNARVTHYLNRGIGYLNLCIGYLTDRGAVAIQQGNYAAAIAHYDRVILRNQQNATYYMHRGVAWVHCRDYDRALADFEHAIQIAPQQSLNYVNRGVCYMHMTDQSMNIERARADLEHAATLDPLQALAYNNRASILIGMEQYDAAIVACQQAKQLAPTLFAAHLNHVEALQLLGENKRALEEHARFLEIDSRAGLCYFQRSSIWFAQSDQEQMYLDYVKALTYAADEILSLADYSLHTLLRCNRRWLFDFYAFAAERMPDDARVYRGRGDVYRVSGDVVNELADYERTLELDPQHAEVVLLRGKLLLEQGENDAAAADFARVLAMTDNLYLRRIASEQLQELEHADEQVSR